ncbi:RND transporter [Paenibacillus chibensis]|uniref:RND transporter n=1 Tax=Paenibacillus chibensis TaxID=59846 RepID=A0ABU6PQX9_9BACL|nr:RND transporter [Paenibacillus chibensis]
MELGKEPSNHKRKRIIQLGFIFFVGMLLFFTLFSNTLQSMNLPKVETEKPVKGSLTYKIAGSNLLQPFAELKLSNPAGWKVEQILVKEGDPVAKRQKLIRYDSKEAEQELDAAVTNLEKQKIEQQTLQDRYIQSAMGEDVMNLRNTKRDIEKGKLEIALQEQKIRAMRTSLNRQKYLTSPIDGLVTKQNAVEGLTSAGEPDLIIANNSLGYRLDIPVDAKLLSNLGLKSGEKVEVEVDAAWDQQSRKISGIITEIVNGEPLPGSANGNEAGNAETILQKTLRIKVSDSELRGGEQASIKLERRSLLEGFLVSSKAVRQDREGMYIFKVEEQPGALGNVFVARKVPIASSQTNGTATMIQSDSIDEDDKIIAESSEPLQDGDRVRMQ